MMRFLGIDPGVTGAYALLDIDAENNQRMIVEETPVVWLPHGTGKRRRYDLGALWGQLLSISPVTFAYLEQQSARPGQGVSSTFATGEGFGIWMAFLTAALIPFAVVSPQRWRSQAGLPSVPGGTDKKAIKEAVRLAACRRFPELVLKLDHADAVMIAVAAALHQGAITHTEGRPDANANRGGAHP